MDDVSDTELTDGEPVEDVASVEEAAAVDEIDREIDGTDEEVQELIDAVLADSSDNLRLIVRYDGDEFEVVYARGDVTDGYTEQELETRVKSFVMQGMSEIETDGPLYDFGQLEATVRFYDTAAVAQVPTGEWTGLVFTFDRTTGSLEELAGRFF